MRILISSLLLILVTIVSLSKGIVVGYYTLNKAYIAANVCENKDKPAMKCDGKCYLRKQMQEANPETSQAPAQPIKLADMVKNIQFPTLYFQSNTLSVVAPDANFWAVWNHCDMVRFGELSFLLPIGMSQSIFHPPCA